MYCQGAQNLKVEALTRRPHEVLSQKQVQEQKLILKIISRERVDVKAWKDLGVEIN